MSIAALFTWMITILGGVILLVIWIIEYDNEFQGAAATRLPVPVISAHALLGTGGIMLWVSYLLFGQRRLAWATVAVLGLRLALTGLAALDPGRRQAIRRGTTPAAVGTI